MKVTLPHNRSKADVKEAVDRSFDDLFKTATGLPLQLVPQQRAWDGNRMNFALLAKLGLLSAPIRGTIEITDSDITIDVDLGIFEKLLPAEKVRNVLSSRVRGLLK